MTSFAGQTRLPRIARHGKRRLGECRGRQHARDENQTARQRRMRATTRHGSAPPTNTTRAGLRAGFPRQLFFAKNLHQPSGLIVPSTSWHDDGAWNSAQPLHCAPSFGPAWYAAADWAILAACALVVAIAVARTAAPPAIIVAFLRRLRRETPLDFLHSDIGEPLSKMLCAAKVLDNRLKAARDARITQSFGRTILIGSSRR